MRKVLTAATLAGIAVLGAAAPAMADDKNSVGDFLLHGVEAGDMSLANVNAADAAKWQVCGQNVLAQPGGQNCDNSNTGSGGSGVRAGDVSGANANASHAAHWQICGQNVGVSPLVGQMCDNGQ